MLTVMSMKVTGSMIRLKDEELMNIWMVPNTWENGEKIANTDMESRVGQTMPDMKAITNMERNMELVLSNGAMAHLTSGNFIITIFTARVFTLGQTTESMKENGAPTKCTEKELSLGPMGVNMSENTLKTKNVVTVNSSGLMEDVTEANGLTVSNMEKVHM